MKIGTFQLRNQRWKLYWQRLFRTIVTLSALLPGLLLQSTEVRTRTALGIGGTDNVVRVLSQAQGIRQFRMPTTQREPTFASPMAGLCHPLKGRGYLSQGVRSGTHRGRAEYAYDLAISIGTPVYAMNRGRVIATEDRYPDTGGGRSKISKFNYIWIEHENGYRSAYLHLQQRFGRKINLRPGSWVKSGQLIGYSGNSGWSTAPHLHIEVQKPGSLSKFTKTVPFIVDADNCGTAQISTAS